MLCIPVFYISTGFEFKYFLFRDSYLSFWHLIDRGGCRAWGGVCWLCLGRLVPLPLLDVVICPFLDYDILSMFHNFGSPLSYHTLNFDLMNSGSVCICGAYICACFLFSIFYYVDRMISSCITYTFFTWVSWSHYFDLMLFSSRFHALFVYISCSFYIDRMISLCIPYALFIKISWSLYVNPLLSSRKSPANFM